MNNVAQHKLFFSMKTHMVTVSPVHYILLLKVFAMSIYRNSENMPLRRTKCE